MIFINFVRTLQNFALNFVIFTTFLFLSLFYSLCSVAIFFSTFSKPVLKRMVPSFKSGPFQGFFLLNERFSWPLWLPGV